MKDRCTRVLSLILRLATQMGLHPPIKEHLGHGTHGFWHPTFLRKPRPQAGCLRFLHTVESRTGSEPMTANPTVQGPYPPGDCKYQSKVKSPFFKESLGTPLLSFLISPCNISLFDTKMRNCANPRKMPWVGQLLRNNLKLCPGGGVP